MRKMVVTGIVCVMCVVCRTNGAVENEDSRDIIVTAARGKRDVSTVPANVTVISSDDLKRSGHISVVDALAGVNGVYVRSITGNPASMDVAMRGFGENAHGRVLVLLDGCKLNRPDMAGINWLQIPISNVERIEIVRGSSTALYGDHAIGGVINIITKTGGAEPVTDISFDLASFGTTVFRIGYSDSAGSLSYSVNGEQYSSDGYRDRTAFDADSIGANLGWDVTEDVNVGVALSWQTIDNELPGWLTAEEVDADRERSNDQADDIASEYLNGHLSITAELMPGHRVECGISLNQKDMDSDMTSWFSFTDQSIKTIGVTPAYIVNGKVLEYDNVFAIGLDWYQDSLDLDRFADVTRTMETLTADVLKETLGLYARNEMALNDGYTLGLGVRTESCDIEAEVDAAGSRIVDDNVTHREQAADISVVKVFENKSKVFVKAATVYRYPFIDEQVTYFGFGTDQFYSDIDPENGWSIEAGVDAWISGSLMCGLTFFNLEMNDEIGWNNDAMRNENMDDTRRQGAELNLVYNIADKGTVKIGYTLTDARFTAGVNDGNDIPLVPRDKASVGLIVNMPLDLIFDALVTYVDESYMGGDTGNVGEKLESYTTVDVTLRYVSKCVEGWEAYVGVDNLFNEEYSSLGYMGWANAYYPSPERSVRGGVSYRF